MQISFRIHSFSTFEIVFAHLYNHLKNCLQYKPNLHISCTSKNKHSHPRNLVDIFRLQFHNDFKVIASQCQVRQQQNQSLAPEPKLSIFLSLLQLHRVTSLTLPTDSRIQINITESSNLRIQGDYIKGDKITVSNNNLNLKFHEVNGNRQEMLVITIECVGWRPDFNLLDTSIYQTKYRSQWHYLSTFFKTEAS